ncbi:MAG: DMT family transporter [Limisphaerales bacterium]
MLAAFLTTILFSISVVCGHRSAKMIGGSEANFWRLACATFFLALYVFSFGQGLSGDSLPLFLWSGLIGIGVGDVALFQALPRLGSRLTILLIQCLSAPFAALIEWSWLGTTLTGKQMLCGLIILTGVSIALAPGKHLNLSPKQIFNGTLFGLLAAFGNALGAVLSRKGYAVAQAAAQNIDGPTAAFQRLLGGLFIGGICLLIVKHNTKIPPPFSSREKWKRIWPWVIINALAGQTIGVSFYQLALKTMPTGIVLPIVALTPLVAIPFAYWLEGDRPEPRSLFGGVIAVVGVVGLILAK